MIFSIRGKGGNTPFPSDTVPVTSTFLLGPAWMSSSAVIVTIPALVVSPAAIVSSRVVTAEERNRSRCRRHLAPGSPTRRSQGRPPRTCSEDGDNRRRIDVTLTDSLDGPVNVALTSGSSRRSPRLVVGLSSRTHSVSVRRRRSSASPPPDPPRRHRWPPTSPRPSSPAR